MRTRKFASGIDWPAKDIFLMVKRYLSTYLQLDEYLKFYRGSKSTRFYFWKWISEAKIQKENLGVSLGNETNSQSQILYSHEFLDPSGHMILKITSM